jgi:hypothetical protein
MPLAIIIVRTFIRSISCLTDTDLILTDKVSTDAAIQTRFTLMGAGAGQYPTGKLFAGTFRVFVTANSLTAFIVSGAIDGNAAIILTDIMLL